MVATFILLICIAPTMRIFTNIYLSQQEIVRENQKAHLVHMAHAKITEQLYKREILISDIKENKVFEVVDADIIKQLKGTPFQISYALSIENSKGLTTKKIEEEPKQEKKPPEYLLKLGITVNDGKKKEAETFEYFIYVDTSPKEKEPEPMEGDDEIVQEENEEMMESRGGNDTDDEDDFFDDFDDDDEDDDEYDFDYDDDEDEE